MDFLNIKNEESNISLCNRKICYLVVRLIGVRGQTGPPCTAAVLNGVLLRKTFGVGEKCKMFPGQ